MKNIMIMTQQELETERNELELLQPEKKLTPKKAERLKEIRIALKEIEQSGYEFFNKQN